MPKTVKTDKAIDAQSPTKMSLTIFFLITKNVSEYDGGCLCGHAHWEGEREGMIWGLPLWQHNFRCWRSHGFRWQEPYYELHRNSYPNQWAEWWRYNSGRSLLLLDNRHFCHLASISKMGMWLQYTSFFSSKFKWENSQEKQEQEHFYEGEFLLFYKPSFFLYKDFSSLSCDKILC